MQSRQYIIAVEEIRVVRYIVQELRRRMDMQSYVGRRFGFATCCQFFWKSDKLWGESFFMGGVTGGAAAAGAVTVTISLPIYCLL